MKAFFIVTHTNEMHKHIESFTCLNGNDVKRYTYDHRGASGAKGENLDAEVYKAAKEYAKHTRGDGEVAGLAISGELRCIAMQKKWSDAKGKADRVIAAGRKRLGDRAMIAAFNARADYHYYESKDLKEALFAYLRGITEFENGSTIGTPEHGKALARSAVLFAEYGKKLGGDKKELYVDRALELYGELSSRYPGYDGDGSIRKIINDARR